MAKGIKLGLLGVGNCASAIVQGVHYYMSKKKSGEVNDVPGVMSRDIGGYDVTDIEFSTAFDISSHKVGKDLSEAIYARPNLTRLLTSVPLIGVKVQKGAVMDGVADHMRSVFNPVSDGNPPPSVDDVVENLKRTHTEILLNTLPVGSEKATRFYADAAAKAGVGFINGIPVFIASDPTGSWPSIFEKAGVPLMGDDVKGQVGATITHRSLARLFHMRGVKIDETYQVNIGGNTDFLNMTYEERLHSKRISKTEAVTSLLPYGKEMQDEGKIRIGPSDYVPFLENNKVCYIYLKGRSFADYPLTMNLKLSVDDKSMFAGAMIDAIRIMKLAINEGVKGVLVKPSAFFFKHPPLQAKDDETAMKWVKDWIGNPKQAGG